MPEAAARLGVARLTVNRWVRGASRVPEGIELHDVIHDTHSRRAYIPEAIVRRLEDALRRARPHSGKGERKGR